ncbi:MAG: hypothetical protein U0794_20195, partial [Isosphaeraceae bacterium]
EELIRRFNTRDQARFYVEHMGASFAEYQAAHDAYHASAAHLRSVLQGFIRSQWVDREFLPNFLFGDRDLVVTLGPDGLVVNTAKYLNGQPLVALNPDLARIDGVLVPFHVGAAESVLRSTLGGSPAIMSVTMARAQLNDGQSIEAVNDLFIGRRTHVSARYRLQFRSRAERQSSSGIIVSTGAGSTGWRRSVLAGAAAIVAAAQPGSDTSPARDGYRFAWNEQRLVFMVREPFASKVSAAELVHGEIRPDSSLEIVSEMPQDGVIFSDGIEEDRLDFNSGAIASIGLSDRVLRLVVAG